VQKRNYWNQAESESFENLSDCGVLSGSWNRSTTELWGHHVQYELTQCYLSPDTSEHA